MNSRKPIATKMENFHKEKENNIKGQKTKLRKDLEFRQKNVRLQ